MLRPYRIERSEQDNIPKRTGLTYKNPSCGCVIRNCYPPNRQPIGGFVVGEIRVRAERAAVVELHPSVATGRRTATATRAPAGRWNRRKVLGVEHTRDGVRTAERGPVPVAVGQDLAGRGRDGIVWNRADEAVINADVIRCSSISPLGPRLTTRVVPPTTTCAARPSFPCTILMGAARCSWRLLSSFHHVDQALRDF